MATVTRLADGGYVETYAGAVDYKERLFVQKYTAGGTAVGERHSLDFDESPQVVALSNGGFVVGLTGFFSFGGNYETIHVYDPASVLLGATEGYYDGSVAASPDGGFAVAFASGGGRGDNDGKEGFIHLFDNNFTNRAPVFKEGPFIDGAPTVTVLDNGDYRFGFADGRSLTIDPANPQDLSNPVAPTVVLLDEATGQGGASATNDPTPTLRVAVTEIGKLQFAKFTEQSVRTITITADDVARGYVDVVDPRGDGDFLVSFRAVDADGLVSGYTILNYRVDTKAPGAASVTRVLDNQPPVEGDVAPGGTTDDRSPSLQVALPGAQAGDVLQVYNGGQPLGERVVVTEADVGRGYATVTPSLADGRYSISGQLTDQVGNVGARGAAFDFTVGAATSPATVSISGGDSKFEGDRGANAYFFTITRSGDTSLETLVDYFVIGQTDSADFAGATTATLTFRPGQTSKTILVVVAGDTVVEPDEAFTVGLSNARGGVIGTGRAEALIYNDDGARPPPPPPSPSGAQVAITGGGSQAEGSAGATPFAFTVTRTGDVSGQALVDYFVIGQTNAADFAGPTTGTLTFAPGETSKTLTLAVAGDTVVEPGEAFTVGLSNARGATLGAASADAVIVNDDGATPPPPPTAGTQLAISGGDAKAEGTGATTPFAFTVTRSGDLAGQTLVDYFVIGQADASDFAGPTSGTLYFGPGESVKTLTLQVAGDAAVEPDESFTLGLSNARGGAITNGRAEAVIRNDDGGTVPPSAGGQVLTSSRYGDTLSGGSANDTLNAGRGPDQLTGGAGGDYFVFRELPFRAGHVTDFAPGTDKLDLRALFQAAGYTGSDPIGDGRLEFRPDGLGNTQVYIDTDAPGSGAYPWFITTLDAIQPGQIGAGDWLFR